MQHEQCKSLQHFRNETFDITYDVYLTLIRVIYDFSNDSNKLKGMADLGELKANLWHFLEKYFPERHALDE